MKAVGIVAEYNPFHNGHIYHLNKAKEVSGADVSVVVMSGNFVQRGQFACIDKWQRAKIAIQHGADLVLELPFVFATQAASEFASGAIDILAKAKVSSIVFGSETNNLEELKEIASLSFNPNNFKENMKKGYSYPKVYSYMATDYGPNDILGICYLRALAKYPEIEPISILRTSDYHNDELDEKLPSALAIRTALKNNQDVSEYTPMSQQLSQFVSPTMEDCYGYIRNIILTSSPEELNKIFLMDEGIENLFRKQAYKCNDYNSFMEGCLSRRYTRSRINRTLVQLLVHNTKDEMNCLEPYSTLRVLAYNDKGKEYLKYLQENEVSVANHYTANQKQYRDIEYKAAVAYSINLSPDMREYICRSEICGLNIKK